MQDLLTTSTLAFSKAALLARQKTNVASVDMSTSVVLH